MEIIRFPFCQNRKIRQSSKVSILVVLIFITSFTFECEAGKRYKVVILPFKDYTQTDLGEMFSDVLRSALTQTGYFEAINKEKTYERVITVIPDNMIMIDDTVREGGAFTDGQIDLLARLDTKRIQRFSKKLKADYAIRGSISQVGDIMRVDTEISDVKSNKMLDFIDAKGNPDELLSTILDDLTNEITLYCKALNAYNDALAVRGMYNQGQYTFDVCEKKLKELLTITNNEVGIHAVLMDLYLSKTRSEGNTLLEDNAIIEGKRVLSLLTQDFKADDLEVFSTLGFDPFHEMAMIYSKRGDNSKAIKIYQKAISVYPMNIAGHYKEIGLLYLQENSEDKAVQAFEESLDVDKSDYEMHFVLASIFEERKYRNKALKHFEECVKYARNAEDIKTAKDRINKLSLPDD